MKKRITALIIVAMVMSLLTACGDEKKTSSTRRSNHRESVLTEETLVEEIRVEEIRVEEIEVREIGWDDNTTYWDDI